MMLPKFSFFLLILFFCKTCFAQDSVYFAQRKIQENLKYKENGQKDFLNSILYRKQADFDFNPYSLDYTELKNTQNLTFNPKCLADLTTVVLDLVNGEYYVQTMLDSQGKLPAGLLWLNIRWLGFYEECMRSEKIVDGEVKIKGKYCTSRTELSPFLGSKGICVPNTCNAQDLETIFGLFETQGSGAGGFNMPEVMNCVEDIPWITGDYVALALCGIIGFLLLVGTACDVVQRINRNKQDSKQQATKSTVEFKGYVLNEKESSLNGTVIPQSLEKQNGAANGAANGHIQENGGFVPDEESQKFSNQQNEQTSENKPAAQSIQIPEKKNLGLEILLCFSLLTNGEKLFSFSSGGNPLSAINGIRSLSFGWVVLGHVYTFVLLYIDNISATDYMWVRSSFQLIIHGTYAVDTFFFLSGLLVSYSTLKILKKTKGKLNWPMFYVHRYIRLTVVYGFSILIMATLWRHVVTGIFQNKIDEGGSPEVDPNACQKYWWTNILYINNFYPNVNDAASCHGVGWYMANDMQFYIISPIYIYLLYRKRLVGHLLVLSAIVTSMLATGIISDKYDLSSLMFGSEPMSADQSYYGWMIYSRPYYRMGAYFVGIAAGEFLLHKPKFNKVFVVIGWIVALGLHYTLLFGMFPYYEKGGFSMSKSMDALYNATHRSVWALSLAWIVYACAHGLGGPINWFLSWNIWGPISRISFAGYLTHQWVLLAFFTGLQQLVHLNDFSATILFTATIAVVLPVATVLSLAVEAPVMRLQKLLLASKG